MSDLPDDGSFMFTSESVGEGHPGESSTGCSYLAVHLTLRVTLEILFIEVLIQRHLTTCHIFYTTFLKRKIQLQLIFNFSSWTHRETGANISTRTALFNLAETVTCTAINLCKLICTSKITPQCCAFTLRAWLVFHSQQHVFTAPHSHLRAAGPECVREGVV